MNSKAALQQLAEIQKVKLLKAITRLQYSYKKVASLSTDLENLDDDILEIWESFSARFSRTSELFFKLLRTQVLLDDPGFTGSFRDLLNRSEKLQWIESSEEWWLIRQLRNMIAHDYSESKTSSYCQQIRELCPKLLALQQVVEQHAS